MKPEITRDVVSDLWPLCCAGEASPETQKLVETFLDNDPAFRSDLERTKQMNAMPPVKMSPNSEYLMLETAREKVRLKYIAIMVAIGASCLLAGAAMFSLLRFQN